MSGGRYPRWVPGIELREDWLELTREEIIDPDREIVDPHHHLWTHGTPEAPAIYELPEFARDTGSGHKVVQTVYIECRARWDLDAPTHLRAAEKEQVATSFDAHQRCGRVQAEFEDHVDEAERAAGRDAPQAGVGQQCHCGWLCLRALEGDGGARAEADAGA